MSTLQQIRFRIDVTPLAVLSMLILCLPNSQLAAAEAIGLKGAFGDEDGCYFYKNGTVRTDSGTYIDREGVWHYEGYCKFLNVENITEMLALDWVKEAWSVKLICQVEGEPYSYDATIQHNENSDGTGLGNVEIRSEVQDGEGVQKLYPCE